MFLDGLILMVLGMGIVFGFLFIIYITLSTVAYLIRKFHKEPIDETLLSNINAINKTDDENVLAIISAAVSVYYRNRR